MLTATQRARGILSGDPITVDRDNDKIPLFALREIADETISVEEVNVTGFRSSADRAPREEQAAIDEAASLAQDDMAAFNGVFGSDSGDAEGSRSAMHPKVTMPRQPKKAPSPVKVPLPMRAMPATMPDRSIRFDPETVKNIRPDALTVFRALYGLESGKSCGPDQ